MRCSDRRLAVEVAIVAPPPCNAVSLLDYGAKGETEALITCAFVADATAELAGRLMGREAQWGLVRDPLADAHEFVARYRDPELLASLAAVDSPRHLDPDFEMVQDTFRRFGDDVIRPSAEHVHRYNADVPEAVIEGLGELGAFGLSVPEEYGGFATGGASDYMGMVVATEELSRASLGIGGSLITRPEILTRALVKGGTEEQKHYWLPKLATAEVMGAVAVTEPDYGSDVAGLKVSATRADGPDEHQRRYLTYLETSEAFARASPAAAVNPVSKHCGVDRYERRSTIVRESDAHHASRRTVRLCRSRRPQAPQDQQGQGDQRQGR